MYAVTGAESVYTQIIAGSVGKEEREHRVWSRSHNRMYIKTCM